MTTQEHDHRENIYESARSRTQYLRDGDQEFLDMELFRNESDRERYRIEILLSCGGPTERIQISMPEGWVEYSYSWGKDAEGHDLHDIDITGEDAEPWIELAETYGECM